MRFDTEWVYEVNSSYYGYYGIRADQNDVEETDADVPGRYKCRNVPTEYLIQ